MFDTRLRPLIDPPLNRAATLLVRIGVTPNALSIVGGIAGIAAGVAIGFGRFGMGFALIIVSRLCDGLDGPVARQTRSSDLGGYLDVLCDYAFYTAVPLGFAFAQPQWALPAACLLGGFLMASTSFLGFATLAAKRGLETEAQGKKSFFYLGGLAEGAETIAVLTLSALVPAWFPVLAYGYALVCAATVVGRVAIAARMLGEQG
ncbi:CDP-alcohol phosphatidyltransferase family protein [Sphingomonas sp. 28-63-12]|uniref:CDP-alcohol phosphatidyltransferase family protein n=1 Tax=Sphingomonas sp. 28-63-12 TaxID=1970434 RepID=UPI000BD051F4|nr:MAG: hypothetical protein B7Y47_06000 [Sphingomonas sp. 28-63-12]